MNEMIDTQVLVIGAGPVGLTLALDLASRGLQVTVVETRTFGEAPSVKCNHVSARSMEIFRRLGVSEKVRAAGLPDDFPHDVSYRTSATGIELTRIKIPSRNGRKSGAEGPDTAWPTPEPPHRVNQIYLEPVLIEQAAAAAGIRLMNRTEIVEFNQDEDGVTAIAHDLETGEKTAIRSDFMIGCDGGRSFVRKEIGARFIGDAVVQRVQSTYIRAPGLLDLLKAGPAWAMFSLNPRRSGNTYAIDGKEKWLVHNYLRDDEPDFESVDRDRSIRTILGVDDDFEIEVLNKEDWFGRRLVADKFRDRRVFICGDAAHLWVPYAGYGMNAGIADAANLAWLMAAHLQGWAPIEILSAHEAERQPITEQVSRFAMNHAHKMAQQRGSVPADIEAEGPEAEHKRAELGRRAYALNVRQYCCGGLNFGYYYDTSPIICYDGVAQPDYSMDMFESSTVPGCRAPHFWFEDGRSLYDAMGDGFALLRLDPDVDVSPFETAATQCGLPFKVLEATSDEAGTAYSSRLVLVRPDQHVAWRGDTLPKDTPALVDTIRGAGTTAA
ncbi:MAG: FAD-dependent oxidoreductase [Rhizobiaceae bacterium]|nr:FAD-dependent oxidoreductase [Rhizobiaceae bacterium]